MTAQEEKESSTQESTLKDNGKVNEETVNKQPEPEKTLLSWRAASRPFKKRDKRFWTTIVIISTIFGLILFLAEGVMPVILIISIIFLFYVLSTVEPEEIEYKITNKGVKIADKTNPWEVLTRFWFTNRLKTELLVFELTRIPGRLETVINSSDKDKLRKVVSEYLPEEQASPSGLDKMANWLAKRLPESS